MLKESYYNIEVARDEKNRVLLYNVSHATVAWIEEDAYLRFHGKATVVPDELLERIAEKHFLVDADLDEIQEQKTRRRQFLDNVNRKNMNFVIAPTMKCNYHCIYCFEKNKQADSCTMTNENAIKAAEFIEELVLKNENCKRLTVTWFGGEPTLAIEKILIIGKYLNDFSQRKGILFETSIISNGYLLTGETVNRLIDVCNLKNIQITMDGTPSIYATMKGVPTDYFYTVVNNIETICDDVHIGIRINAIPDNENDVYDLIRYLLKDRKLNKKIGLYCAPVFECYDNQSESIFSDKSFSDFAAELQEELYYKEGLQFYTFHNIPVVCTASCASQNKNFFVIGPDMNLYRCEHFLGHKEAVVGNVDYGVDADNTFDPVFFADLDDKCQCCKYLPICQGGCVADRIQNYNSNRCETVEYTTKNRLRNMLRVNGKKEYKDI